MGEGEFLGVAVADLGALCFERGLVRVDAELYEQHLEHVLLVHLFARDHRAVHEQRDVFGLVAEHEVRVVVLPCDSAPEVPKRVLRAPLVAESGTFVLLDAFRGEFRAFLFGDVLQFEPGEELLPFVLERSGGQCHVRRRQAERVNAVSGAGDEAHGLVGRFVALARHIKERPRDPEGHFRVCFGEGRLLAARLVCLHFHLGAVHELQGFALRELDFHEHGAAACARVVEFVGDAALVDAVFADYRPVAPRELEAETVGTISVGAFACALFGCLGASASVVVKIVVGIAALVYALLRVGLGQGLPVSGTGN